MRLITLDFEVFYDTREKYSLSSMTTEDFTCDPRFEEIGLSVKVDAGASEWFSGPRREIAAWLRQFEVEKNAILSHNMKWDGLVLAVHYNLFPALYLDTLSMARPICGSHLKRLGLKHLAEHFGLGEKGDEVERANGMRLRDFTPEQLAAYGAYCINDNDLTYALYQRMRNHMRPGVLPANKSQWIRFPDDELRSIDKTIRMYTQPQLRLNVATLEKNLEGIQERKRKIISELEVQGVNAATLRSNDKFAALLESHGVDIPLKPSPASLKRGDDPVIMTYAFGAKDEGFKAMKEQYADDEFISAVLAARVSEKSTGAESRHKTYIAKAKNHHGIARVPLKYSGAHTTRDSGEDDENWQNPAKVSKDRLRYAIEVPPGHVLVDMDQAQIEARLTSVVAGQDDLTKQFERGEDVYSNYASQIYGRKIDRKLVLVRANGEEYCPDEVEGKVGKESILGLGFQMGAEKFRITLIGNANVNEPIEVVKGYVDTYRATFPKITKLWEICQAAVKNALLGRTTEIGPLKITPEGILFPTGMLIAYPNLGITKRGNLYYRRAKDKWDQNLFGGKIVENFIQKLARDIVFWQANLITKETGFRHALRVHDSLIHVIPEAKVEGFVRDALEIMRMRPMWLPNAPLKAEAKVGLNYGDLRELKLKKAA